MEALNFWEFRFLTSTRVSQFSIDAGQPGVQSISGVESIASAILTATKTCPTKIPALTNLSAQLFSSACADNFLCYVKPSLFELLQASFFSPSPLPYEASAFAFFFHAFCPRLFFAIVASCALAYWVYTKCVGEGTAQVEAPPQAKVEEAVPKDEEGCAKKEEGKVKEEETIPKDEKEAPPRKRQEPDESGTFTYFEG
jgi:hypothetical protein